VTVGLGQHQRDTPADGRKADRAGHVAATPHHRIRADFPKQRSRAPERLYSLGERAGGTQGIAASEPFHRDPPQRITGGRHQLDLGALTADEGDLRALSPQRVCHRERRRHVPGRPPGGYRESLVLAAHGPILPARAAARRHARAFASEC
jgi:hypothetical protein